MSNLRCNYSLEGVKPSHNDTNKRLRWKKGPVQKNNKKKGKEKQKRKGEKSREKWWKIRGE